MTIKNNGWYCAQCERGVDPSEVTYNEAHTECGRTITDDEPPAPQPAEVGADDDYSLAHEIWATAQLGPHDSIADAVDRIAALLARAQLTAAGGRGDLVQALAELCDEIEKHSIHTLISATNITWFKRKARAALAALSQPAKESKSCE